MVLEICDIKKSSLKMGNCWHVWARAWGLVHERGEREVWKAIRNCWEAFKANTCFKVGSRNRVKFWKDG